MKMSAQAQYCQYLKFMLQKYHAVTMFADYMEEKLSLSLQLII